MKLMRLFSVFLLGAFINATAAAGDSTTVSLTNGKFNNDSSYKIELKNQDGATWTYEVTGIDGHDLSHWVLGLGAECSVESASPSHDGVQVDPSVENIDGIQFYGIKWNSSGGTFSFTLDKAYSSKDIPVLAKASRGYGEGLISGPDCSNPVSDTGSSDDSSSDNSSSDDSSSDDSSSDNSSSDDSSSDDSSSDNSSSDDSSSDDSSSDNSGSDDSSSDDTNNTSSNCGDIDGGDSVTLTAGGSNKSNKNKPTDYTISFEGASGNIWTYSVYRESGSDKRALSHWSLGMGNCNIVSTTGSGVEVGNGGSTTADGALSGQPLVKWNTDVSTNPNNPTIFTFTLDGEYAATNATVVAKTGGDYKSNDGIITAPDCNTPLSSSCSVDDDSSNPPTNNVDDDSSNPPTSNVDDDSSNPPTSSVDDDSSNPPTSNVDDDSSNQPTSDEPEWANGFSGEYIAWGQMGNGSGTNYFGETLWTDDSICTLAKEGVLDKPWYEPQWVKARGRIVLFKQDGDDWVQGGKLKMKLSLGWYTVHPKNSRNLTDEPIICPTVMPNGVELPVECADGPADKYEDGHYLTSREILTSDENGVIEFETFGWWAGVSEGYRDALNLVTVSGAPDWTGRTEYIVENHYGGTLRAGEENQEYLLANLDFNAELRGIGRDVAWNAAWSQVGCDLPVDETDESTENEVDETDQGTENEVDETDQGTESEVDETDQGVENDSTENGGNIDCPAGSEMLVKFEWNGSRYVLEGENAAGVILRGTTIEQIANATGGQWTSAVPLAYLVLKGANDNYTYDLQGVSEGSFSKDVLEGNGNGGSPDISNMKFCGDPNAPKDFDDLAVTGVEVVSSTRIWTLPESELLCDNDCDPALLHRFSVEGNTINILDQADLLLELEVSDTKGLPLRYEYMFLDIGQ